jgi:citrate/tricarballylate utilization protein
MPSPELLQEAERQLTVCNSCRYCEGYCAVFPAMELRRDFDEADIVYLSNLCFECRACYYACPFTPPHEYGINIPEVLSSVRVQTYREYSSPALLSRLFFGRRLVVALTVAAAVFLIFVLVLAGKGTHVLFGTPPEGASFYRVIPYLAMVLPALALSGLWIGALFIAGRRFWRETRPAAGDVVDTGALLRATRDAAGLEYLKGGGDGCAYPDERPSNLRRWSHHLLVAGVLLDLASTTLAAVYHNFLGRDAPYPYLSAPVVLGTVGGILILAGGLGLLWLKQHSDKEAANAEMLNLDVIFLVLLLLTSASGLLLLVLRETAAQGTLLVLHLGIVAALYLALPYGKFAHVVHRYLALVRYRVEQARAGGAAPSR